MSLDSVSLGSEDNMDLTQHGDYFASVCPSTEWEEGCDGCCQSCVSQPVLALMLGIRGMVQRLEVTC